MTHKPHVVKTSPDRKTCRVCGRPVVRSRKGTTPGAYRHA